jgi:hypothetical protein
LRAASAALNGAQTLASSFALAAATRQDSFASATETAEVLMPRFGAGFRDFDLPAPLALYLVRPEGSHVPANDEDQDP